MKNRYSLRSIVVTTSISLFLTLSCYNPGPNKVAKQSVPGTVDKEKLLRENKALVIKFYEALNDTNWSLAKTLIDKDYKHYFVKDTGFVFTSWNGFEQGYKKSHTAFPDWKLTPFKIIAEGDYVSVLLRAEGTHLGNFAGIPATKVKARAPIMLLHEIKEGKLIADWEIMNTALFLKQLKE
jgi:predicted ester cyclase